MRALCFSVVLSLWLWTGIAFGAVTLRDILNDARYWPPACENNICTLTGLGGIVSVWLDYIDDNAGKQFVVSGICASACEMAYQKAILSKTVIILPGTVLIKHPIERLKY